MLLSTSAGALALLSLLLLVERPTRPAAETDPDPYNLSSFTFSGEPVAGIGKPSSFRPQLLGICVAGALFVNFFHLGLGGDLSWNVGWIVFWCAVGILCRKWVGKTGGEELKLRWGVTVRLSTLTLLSTALLFFILILPESFGLASPYENEPVLGAVAFAMSALALATTCTTPKCPPLHFTPPVHVSIPTFATEDLSDTRESTKDRDPTAANVSRLAGASPFDILFFNWVSHLLNESANKRQLSREDVPHLTQEFKAENCFRWMKTFFGGKRDTPTPKLWNPLLWRVVNANRRAFGAQICLALCAACLFYLPAFVLQKFGDDSLGIFYCFSLLVAMLMDSLVSGQLWYLSTSHLSAKIKTQLNTIIFEKTLKRKDAVSGDKEKKKDDDEDKAKEEGKKKKGFFDFTSDDEEEENDFKTKSQVLNLFVVDVDRISDFSNWSFSLVDAPAELVIGTVFLCSLLGAKAAFSGILIAILFVPFNHWTSKKFAVVQDKLMNARDKRVSLMNEVLQSVRMLKFMAWERPFENRIMAARGEELRQQRNNFLLEIAFNFTWATSPVICILVTFLVYTKVEGHELTPARAFTALAVFNELKFALNIIPETFIQGIQTLVSLRRIEKYLASDEVENTIETVQEQKAFDHPIGFRNASVTWPASVASTLKDPSQGRTFTMSNLNMEFPEKHLSLICGPLGSGKTLLLLSLLGEAELLEGDIFCPRSPPNSITLSTVLEEASEATWIRRQCAYVPQNSWLQNASIRDNILFGLPFLESRYNAVLEACSLNPDLAILEDGDQTEIGERGVNLSGGQKQRVALARAVYSRADTLLLDDCLSAFDNHTTDKIFKECFQGPLLENRTVILVSHHVQLVTQQAAFVIALENGAPIFQGGSKRFLDSPTYVRLVGVTQNQDADEDVEESKPENKHLKVKQEVVNGTGDNGSGTSTPDDSDDDSAEDVIEKLPDQQQQPPPTKKARKLIATEARAVGRVRGDVWKKYLTANGGAIFWIFLLVVFLGTKGMDVLESWWLSVWSRSYSTPERRSIDYYLSVYALISMLNVVVSSARWVFLYAGGIRASTQLYKELLHAILRAPLRFFDTIEHGRLMNRFGQDFEKIDQQLPDHYGRSFIYLLGVATTVGTIISIAPAFLMAFLLIGTAYYHFGMLYTTVAREMRRLDSVSKSPVYSIYGEAISGAAVIRGFGASSRFMSLMLSRVTTNVTFFYFLWSTNRWLSVRFALLSSSFVATTAFVLLKAGNRVDAALAGFAMSFALKISGDMLFLVRRATALELAMVSIERVKEFSEVKPEAPEIMDFRPPASWPHSGEVSVENVVVRYSPELPNVLHGLSFHVPGGMKVGIVGSTGCGKSTLAQTFFRFVELWEGRIVLDGIDCSKIGLTDLRSRLTIIPQDPQILSGTLRSALDVFGEYTDAELFDALRRVHLLKSDGERQSDLPEELLKNQARFDNLDAEVTEHGANFSQGQRQLLCMARALLKRTKLMILDEATASIDYETDELITQTIKHEFADSTLLCIAHRLRTVITFDRILVLNKGNLAEYDTPLNLIKNENSLFHKFCKSSGRSEFRTLQRMAEGKVPRSRRRSSSHRSGRSTA
ncbi:P-loop containing nucleoside triphosphate hydrolase protein [Atractiella rhizophila]|nr:P-loop containing nucleoside triphosphate hydrolase protein [Atractiella rhizophila]